ncbi:MAG TPA: YsnF/AvaK domain-containing protein [Anditalea sp.]|nr:YsnF/AvaK domain-containing protein [Anditalea sp.]
MEDKKDQDDSYRRPDPKVIPVIEERLKVDKEKVETGRISITKKVHEEEVTENISVTEENITVKRKEINEYVDSAPPAIRQEGDCTIISVVKEVLVVEKKLMLVEELHVTKHKTESSVPVNDTLRKEEVIVKQSDHGTGFDKS